MRLLVKVGGAQLVEPDAQRAFAKSVASATAKGLELVLIHGGGEQVRRLGQRLGLPERKVRGLRVTDEATAEVALMVLGGQVNRTLVARLGEAGARAVGLTGADGGLLGARPLDPELGLVGAVEAVDAAVVFTLLDGGFVPVVATLAPLAWIPEGGAGPLYNINADHVVGPLARAIEADAVLFLTDVDAVRGAGGEPLAELDRARAAELVDAGVIAGGMIPKVEAALDAAVTNPRALVRIASADEPDAIERALQAGFGTTFYGAPPTDG